MTDPNDLAALADRLTARESDDGTIHVDPADAHAAERILRAVAAAPGPLRTDGGYVWLTPQWADWFDALADAVGEP